MGPGHAGHGIAVADMHRSGRLKAIDTAVESLYSPFSYLLGVTAEHGLIDLDYCRPQLVQFPAPRG